MGFAGAISCPSNHLLFVKPWPAVIHRFVLSLPLHFSEGLASLQPLQCPYHLGQSVTGCGTLRWEGNYLLEGKEFSIPYSKPSITKQRALENWL